jgi:hypothetical protein
MIYQTLPNKNSSVPLISNTGGTFNDTHKLKLGVDWVSGTFHESRIDEVKFQVNRTFSDLFPFPAMGRCGLYQRSYRSVKGVVIGFDPEQTTTSTTKRQDAYLSIPAEVLKSVSVEELWYFFRRLHDDFKFRCSRLDVYIDDYQKRVTPAQIYKYFQEDKLFGFKNHDFRNSGRKKGENGASAMFGRRGKSGAGKYLRCYDKSYESRGEIDAIRYELELSQEHSRERFKAFATFEPQAWSGLIKSIMVSSFDFVNTKTGKKRDGKRMKFWQQIVGDAVEIPFDSCRKKPTMQEQVRWIHKQVSRVFAKLMNCFENHEDMWVFHQKFLEHGYAKLTPQDLIECEMVRSGRLQLVDCTV